MRSAKVDHRLFRNLVSMLRSALHFPQFLSALYSLQEPKGGDREGSGIFLAVLKETERELGNCREGSQSSHRQHQPQNQQSAG